MGSSNLQVGLSDLKKDPSPGTDRVLQPLLVSGVTVSRNHLLEGPGRLTLGSLIVWFDRTN